MRTLAIGMSLVAGAVWGVSTLAQSPPPAAAAAPAAIMSLTALKQIETGLWQFEIVGRAPKQSCVAETTALVQIEHDQPNCSRFVIANDPKSATVHYSCQRAGWGRTTVRVENATSVTIHTQGISKNQPFDYSVQAKRVGACGTQTTLKQR